MSPRVGQLGIGIGALPAVLEAGADGADESALSIVSNMSDHMQPLLRGELTWTPSGLMAMKLRAWLAGSETGGVRPSGWSWDNRGVVEGSNAMGKDSRLLGRHAGGWYMIDRDVVGK